MTELDVLIEILVALEAQTELIRYALAIVIAFVAIIASLALLSYWQRGRR